MTEDQAIELLRLHAQDNPDSKCCQNSEPTSIVAHGNTDFLCETFFVDVMKSIKTLSKRFSGQTIEKEIVANLMKICHRINEWHTSHADQYQHDNPQLVVWSEMIDKVATGLLRGHHPENVFQEFEEYQENARETSSVMSYD